MAWRPPTEDDEGHFSKYNEAWLKMKRIHQLQDYINHGLINPTDYNEVLRVFNYQLILSCCASIISECWGKLNEDAREDALKYKAAMEKILRKYPIHSMVKDVNSSQKQIMKYDSRVWDVITKWLYEYNLKCRDFLAKAGYDSPDFDYDDDGL